MSRQAETILECPVKYRLEQPDGHAEADDQARICLTADDMRLMPTWGQALRFHLREIAEVAAADYQVNLTMTSGEQLTLYHLGPRYDDFLRILSGLRNEMTLRDLLMHETLIKSGMKGSYVRVDGGESRSGLCEIRLYETALVLIPASGEIERIPYSYIASVTGRDYTLTIDTEHAGHLELSGFGPGFDLLQDSLSRAIGELQVRTQERLQALVPGAAGSVIRRVSTILKDGRAARRKDIDAICPELWDSLLRQIDAAGLADKYRYLETLADPDQIYAGIKRGLPGDLSGQYIWFLVPICSTDPNRPGNVVVMEAIADGGSKATYCFRLTGRRRYRELSDPDVLQQEVDEFIKIINRCMVAINFRREPVYLPADRLADRRYQHYRVAAERIPELKLLRGHLIGRVLYYSPDQWRRDLDELLQFNVSTDDDLAQWKTDAGDEDSSD